MIANNGWIVRKPYHQIIRQVPTGLSSDIAKIVALAPSSSLFAQIKNTAGIRREKHKGRFTFLQPLHNLCKISFLHIAEFFVSNPRKTV